MRPKIAPPPLPPIPLSSSPLFPNYYLSLSDIIFFSVYLFIVCSHLQEDTAFMWICFSYCCLPRNQHPEFNSLSQFQDNTYKAVIYIFPSYAGETAGFGDDTKGK